MCLEVGPSLRRGPGSVFLCRRYICCIVVSSPVQEIAAGPRQHGDSWFRVPRDSWRLWEPSDLRLSSRGSLTTGYWQLDDQWLLAVKVTLRQTVGQSVLVSSHIWGPRPDICYCQAFAVLSMWGALSDERTGLSFVAVTVVKDSGSLWVQIIYSFICNSSIYVCTIYTRPLSV
jgi:hypothetical protein